MAEWVTDVEINNVILLNRFLIIQIQIQKRTYRAYRYNYKYKLCYQVMYKIIKKLSKNVIRKMCRTYIVLIYLLVVYVCAHRMNLSEVVSTRPVRRWLRLR